MKSSFLRIATIATTLLLPSVVYAQPVGEDRVAAANAFAEAQRAQLRRDWARAAEFFELADQYAASDAALRSAIRNHQAAGNLARAATLALRARERYPDDPQTVQLAQSVLGSGTSGLGRLNVRCNIACGVTVDNRVISTIAITSYDMFVEPGEHQISASWPQRSPVQRTVTVTAQQELNVALEQPPAPVDPPVVDAGVTANVTDASTTISTPDAGTVSENPMQDTPRRPLHPAVFGIVAAATAVSAGILVWSGVDTLVHRDAYVQMPTEARFNEGVGLQTRTNVLIGVTATLGVAAGVIGIFLTEWRGPSVPRTRALNLPTFIWTSDMAVIGWSQRF